MNRRRIVAAGLTAVVAAALGLIYLEVAGQVHATRTAWIVTRDVVAGTRLEGADVGQVRVALPPDRFPLLEASPVGRWAAHAIGARSLLRADDLVDGDSAQVAVTVRSSPAVSAGDTLDLYAVVGGHAVLVGRRLIVVATGSPLTLLVPAGQEPYWVALQASSVQLFASKSDGAGVPDIAGVTSVDAINELTGTAQSGQVLTGSSAPSPSPPPSPAP